MKLMYVIVPYDAVDGVVQLLVESRFRVTRVASTGGFLRRGNVTLMIGVEEDKVQAVIDLLRNACAPQPQDSQNHVTIFVVNMPFFEQI
jgi:uncharacterized protein YaaQ